MPTQTAHLGKRASRADMFRVDPRDKQIVLVKDRSDPLFRETALMEAPRWLVDSIKRHGVKVPIVLKQFDEISKIVEGRKRYLAALVAVEEMTAERDPRAKNFRIPAIMERGDERTAALLAQVLNDLREQQGDYPMARARAIQHLIDGSGWSVEEVAEELGKKPAQIRATLQLLEAAPKLQRAVEGGLPMSTALEVVRRHKGHDEQAQALERLQAAGATHGRTAKQAVRDDAGGKPVQAMTKCRSAIEVQQLLFHLQAHKGTMLAHEAARLITLLDWVLRHEDKLQADPWLAQQIEASRRLGKARTRKASK